MAHRCHATLVLRGRPARFPRRLSEADRVTLLQFMHRIRALEREVDRLNKLGSELISAWLLIGTNGTMIRDLQQLYRDLATEIRGLRAREIPGMNRSKKEDAFALLNLLAEEMHGIRAEMVDIRGLLEREAGS
jgi:hypothetical protein